MERKIGNTEKPKSYFWCSPQSTKNFALRKLYENRIRVTMHRDPLSKDLLIILLP
jgi:hypothetical protein